MWGKTQNTAKISDSSWVKRHPLIYRKHMEIRGQQTTNLQGHALESDKQDVVFETGALVFHRPMNNEVH
jgi:hypothetical protein